MEGFTKYLKIGDEMDVMIFLKNDTSLTLKTFVYEVTNDQKIIMANPISEGILYPMEKSNEYYFRFFLENVGMFLFKGNVINRITYDNLPAINITLTSPIKKVQRRRFFRVRFMSKGNFLHERHLSEEEIKQLKEKLKAKFKNENDIFVDETIVERVPFDTLDLSGGGIRVVTNNPYEIDEFVEGEFQISGKMVKFKGEVTRNEKNASNRFEVGIRFIDLDSNTQSEIVAYVFEIERNLIKKGLI